MKKFTLIELLVVVSIIGILAALVLPMVAGSNQRTLVLKAKTDIAAIKMAIEKYQVDNHGKLPVAGFFTTNGEVDDDYMAKNGRLTDRGYDVLTQVLSDTNIEYDASTSPEPLVNIDEANAANPPSSVTNPPFKMMNPRHVSYLDVPQDFALNGLRDPWGKRYVIVLDYETYTSSDNKNYATRNRNDGGDEDDSCVMLDNKINHPAIDDELNLGNAVGNGKLADSNLFPMLRASVLVYSLGRDGADTGGLGSEFRSDYDDVNSWSSM